MKKIRIGKDIKARWSVTVNGEPADLASMDLKLIVQDSFGRCREQPFVIEGSDIVFAFRGTEQRTLGRYAVTLWANHGKNGQTCLDNCEAFYLVQRTCQEDDGAAEGLSAESVSLSGDMALGVQGKSAYEAWLSQGHEGTEADFVAWLRKPAEDIADEAMKLCRDAADLAREIGDHPPVIGDNGNWFVWDIGRDLYIDTGKPSTGDVLFPTFNIDPETMELVMDCPDGTTEGLVTLENGELIFNA